MLLSTSVACATNSATTTDATPSEALVLLSTSVTCATNSATTTDATPSEAFVLLSSSVACASKEYIYHPLRKKQRLNLFNLFSHRCRLCACDIDQ